MLERIGDPRYASLSNPSWDLLYVLDHILKENTAPVVAEVGVGIGATSVEIGKRLNNKGTIYLFDYTHTLAELIPDLNEVGVSNVIAHGSSRTLYDSYTWQLLKLLHHRRTSAPHGMFDLAYLDGAHSFVHDVGATALLLELVKPGGYLLFDDYNWTFNTSPTMNPEKMPDVRQWYSEEQLSTPHVKLICETMVDTDQRYERRHFDGRISERRALYQRIAP